MSILSLVFIKKTANLFIHTFLRRAVFSKISDYPSLLETDYSLIKFGALILSLRVGIKDYFTKAEPRSKTLHVFLDKIK